MQVLTLAQERINMATEIVMCWQKMLSMQTLFEVVLGEDTTPVIVTIYCSVAHKTQFHEPH